MPAPAAPSSKRTQTSTSKHAGKREPGDDDDAKPYVVVNHIGKGSFADVYKGYHEVRTAQVSTRIEFDHSYSI